MPTSRPMFLALVLGSDTEVPSEFVTRAHRRGVPASSLAAALAFAGGASAQVIAPNVQEGELAVAPDGTPFVAYVRASALRIVSRAANGRWHTRKAGPVASGGALVAFAAGKAGPVAVLLGPDERSLVLVQGRRRKELAGALPPA